MTVRRLHDTGRSAWWLLLGFVPFGSIALLVFQCLDSDPQPNRFGPSPKPWDFGQYGAEQYGAQQLGSPPTTQYGAPQPGGQQPSDNPFAPPPA